MSERTLYSETDCREIVSQLFKGNSGLEKQFVSAVVECCRSERTSESQRSTYDLVLGSWVIRDKDLDFFKVFKESVVSAAGAGFILGNLSVGTLAGILLSLLSLWHRIRIHGVNLSPIELQILAALKAEGNPKTAEDLAQILECDIESINLALFHLSEIVTRSGVVPFIRETSSGWWIEGV